MYNKKKYKYFPYNPKLKLMARKLRNEATFGEILLWQKLRKKQLSGYDFHRQKPIHYYILDFFCAQLKLGIEIDGFTHNDRLASDEKRQEYLNSLGITILRFTEENVRDNLDGVVQDIINWIGKHTPNPSQEGNLHTPSSFARGELRKKILKFTTIFTLFFSFFCFSAVSVKAGIDSNLNRFSETSGYKTESNKDVSPVIIIAQIIKLALSVLGVIFVILIIHAGYLWMTAGGDSEQVSVAKNKINRAFIGLIIIIMAYAITYFVMEKLVEDIVTR
ncbi:DUF559 domain-containing protein [Patescibacteria group bacterium]